MINAALWTWVYKYLFETLLSILLDIHLEVELLHHMVILLLIFEDWYTIVYSGCVRGSTLTETAHPGQAP